MKNLLLLLLLPCLTTPCWARSTICKVEDNVSGIQAIAWNDEQNTAKITDSLNSSFDGVITLKRQHGDDGDKVNLLFVFTNPYFGSDAAEFIVFPVGKNKYRVIGVTYVVSGGKRHLSTSMGNDAATCLSM
jgi:hypothetical protein